MNRFVGLVISFADYANDIIALKTYSDIDEQIINKENLND